MPTSFVHATIRRANRNRLILCGIVVLLLIGLAALNARYLYNFFAGPLRIDRATLLATGDPGTLQRYWVTVEGDDVADTGYQQVRRDKDTGTKTVTAAYMALLLDRRVLLVKAQDDARTTGFTGYLEPLPSDIRSNVIADAEREVPALRGAFLPYMLNTSGFRDGGFVALAIGIPLFGLCVYGIARAIQRTRNPLKHPIMRALGRFGAPGDVAGQIDAELLADHPRLDRLHLTPNWLVEASPSNLAATRIEDIVWAYKQVTQRRVNGVPAGKTYTAQIWDRHGVCITIAGSETFVNQALDAAARRAPWMMAGYSTELEKAWKSNRAAVLATVDQRRQQVILQAAGAAQAYS
jgi:hypothetical protein